MGNSQRKALEHAEEGGGKEEERRKGGGGGGGRNKRREGDLIVEAVRGREIGDGSIIRVEEFHLLLCERKHIPNKHA